MQSVTVPHPPTPTQRKGGVLHRAGSVSKGCHNNEVKLKDTKGHLVVQCSYHKVVSSLTAHGSYLIVSNFSLFSGYIYNQPKVISFAWDQLLLVWE